MTCSHLNLEEAGGSRQDFGSTGKAAEIAKQLVFSGKERISQPLLLMVVARSHHLKL